MKNPWLKILYSDYENHMKEVGQTQALNELTKYYLDKYLPENFALLGCSTGNGFEHIKQKTTKNVYAIDINPTYLEITKERFNEKIDNLEICNIDIQKDELPFKKIDLFFVGLVLEYVEPEKALLEIIKTISRNGILVIVIQKNEQTTFVSKTKYKSLKKLSKILNEVNEKEINTFIQSQNTELINRNEIKLTKDKSFISLEYRVK